MITALTLAPVVAALLILALPERRARAVALAGALASLARFLSDDGGGTLSVACVRAAIIACG